VAAVLGVLRELELERLLCRERCRERDLCVAMICQRLIAPCSNDGGHQELPVDGHQNSPLADAKPPRPRPSDLPTHPS
jgi:hypothetical protein